MKILAVADTISEALLEKIDGRPFLDGIELIISCGDLPPEYLSSLRNRYDAPLLYVLGNHDLRYSQTQPIGCRDIHRKTIVIDGLRVTGFSGSRWYNGSINQYTEREMGSFIRRMRFRLWRTGGTDLVVTHAPPRYINDAEDRCHRGFHVFRKFIDRYQPPVFLHGHIHRVFADDSERITAVNSTRVINCYGYYTFEL